MLGARKIITEVDRRRQIRIPAGYGVKLRGIITGKRRPLNAGPDRKVEFLFLDPPGQGDLVGVLREFIGIAEQAVIRIIAFQRIDVVIRIVDRRAVRIDMAIVQLQDHVFGKRFCIRQGRLDRDRMQRVIIILVKGMRRILYIEVVGGISVAVAIIDIS